MRKKKVASKIVVLRKKLSSSKASNKQSQSGQFAMTSSFKNQHIDERSELSPTSQIDESDQEYHEGTFDNMPLPVPQR